MNCKYVLKGILVILLGYGLVSPATAEPIELAVTSRPPYYIFEGGGTVSGIVATPVAQVFEAAKIDHRWVNIASNRQLKEVKENLKPICAVGWFKNPEREKFSKYTDYIYQNKPLIAMVRSDNNAVAAHRTLRALMKDTTLRMGKKLGYSYGPTVDGLVDELSPSSITTSQDNAGMTRMLIGRRFDYFISSPEEGEYLIEALGIGGVDVVLIKFEDLPPGNKRYVLCSKSVSDKTIEKLNAAIQANLR
jgi:polar amino acid transport system substrate-binding protein